MLNCPHCRHLIDDAPDLAGQMVACPACGSAFTMPVYGQLISATQPPAPAPQVVYVRHSHARRKSTFTAGSVWVVSTLLIVTVFVGIIGLWEWRVWRAKQEIRAVMEEMERIIDKASDDGTPKPR